jgi:excinuclease ABC subunit A
VIGKKWHLLPKGFPEGAKPIWSFDLLEALLQELEKIVGGDSTECISEKSLGVHLSHSKSDDDSMQPWVIIETKNPSALKVLLLGEMTHLDAELIAKQKVPCRMADRHEEDGYPECPLLELELVDAKQLRSRYLKSLFRAHFAARQKTAK